MSAPRVKAIANFEEIDSLKEMYIWESYVSGQVAPLADLYLACLAESGLLEKINAQAPLDTNAPHSPDQLKCELFLDEFCRRHNALSWRFRFYAALDDNALRELAVLMRKDLEFCLLALYGVKSHSTTLCETGLLAALLSTDELASLPTDLSKRLNSWHAESGKKLNTFSFQVSRGGHWMFAPFYYTDRTSEQFLEDIEFPKP